MIVLSKIAKLYDGSAADDSALHTHVDLLIDGGRVKAVQAHDPALAASEAHTVVDCSAYTVTPGLIDCHAHVTRNRRPPRHRRRP